MQVGCTGSVAKRERRQRGDQAASVESEGQGQEAQCWSYGSSGGKEEEEKWQDLMYCSVGNTMTDTKRREKRKAGMTARLRNSEHKGKVMLVASGRT